MVNLMFCLLYLLGIKMPEKPEPGKQHDNQYPDITSACLVCHGHGHEILADLTYCKCRRCSGSGVDPAEATPGLPVAAFISMDERGRRVVALAKQRASEREKEEDKPNKTDSPSGGGDGMSDLEC